jgi:hypothetical protein
LHRGYIIGAQGIEAGLTSVNTVGFSFVELQRNAAGSDWMQPWGSLSLPDGFSIDLPVLMDTGINEMLLWLNFADRPAALANVSPFPAGVPAAIAVPPAPYVPSLQYSFVTGDASDPMAPSAVEWRDGNGINTGRNVLAGADYLYDAGTRLIGFRIHLND